MTPFIVRYKLRDLPGGPLGELILSNRQTLAVWSDDVHQQCLELSRIPALPVTIKTRTSKTGNVYLIGIESAESEQDTYDRLRAAEEQGPHLKAGGYESRRIAEKTTSTPEHIPLESEITQVSTMPPEGK